MYTKLMLIKGEKAERPKVKFPTKWTYAEKKFVVKGLKDALDTPVIARMAEKKGFKHITKDTVRNFASRYEARLKAKLGYPTGEERRRKGEKK
jgi:hypothetical protein